LTAFRIGVLKGRKGLSASKVTAIRSGQSL
jgi:hypothetical protein